MKELWLTGYYQSLTTISKLRRFQTTAHISVFFGKTENSGIVHTLIVDQGTNYVRGPSLSHYLFMHIGFIERTCRNRYMQIKGGGWYSESSIASHQGCSSLSASFGSIQLYPDEHEPWFAKTTLTFLLGLPTILLLLLGDTYPLGKFLCFQLWMTCLSLRLFTCQI